MQRIFIVIAAVAVVGLFAVPSFLIQKTIEEKTINVVGKERITSVSSGKNGTVDTSIENYVYTDDEVYIVKDSFWNFHFRAGTVYAKIPDAKATCQVTLSGVRWGFFSMYQNIIEATCEGL